MARWERSMFLAVPYRSGEATGEEKDAVRLHVYIDV